jgi:rhodanese-related sulfurtransferase
MKTTKTTIIALLISLGTTLYSCEGNSQAKTAATNLATEQKVEALIGSIQNISQEEFLKIQAEGKAVVMDVRTAGEVSEGCIKGATVFADINSSTFQDDIAKLDKSKPYLVYCRSGARSGRAAQMMIDAGFTTVYNLNGGISNWSGEVEKK